MWSLHWWHPNQAHNGYIETYLNLGWLGIIVCACVIITGYQRAADLLKREPEAGRIRIALFVVAIIYACTEAAIKMMHPVWIVFLLTITAVPNVPEPRLPTVLVRMRSTKMWENRHRALIGLRAKSR